MKIPKEIKTVIFDLDGLLLDSEPAWAEADTELLGKRGFSPTPELFVKRLGTGPRQTIEIYKEEFGITEDTQSLINERLGLFFEKLEKNLELMHGAYDLIIILSNVHKKLAIATSGPYKNKIYDYIKRLNLENYFSVVITGEDIKKPKPDPEIFLLASG